MTMSRRQFFQKSGGTAAAIAFANSVAKLGASPLGLPIGSQTYPHRAMIQKGDFAGLAKIMSQIGVQELEMCSPFGYDEFKPLADPKQVKQVLSDHGLSCRSGHFGMDELRSAQQRSIDWAKEVGITQMITATLDGDHPTEDDVKRAADEYNRIAAVASKNGIQQGLHNEGFECASVGGRRVYDMLFDLLDPKLVKFQFQMSTITRGFVAADYFRKYPGRFYSMHLQDVDLNPSAKAGPPRPDDDAEPGVVQVPLGKGSIDWKTTFEAAKTGGVQNYFVEQNMDFTKESVAYLKTLKV